MLFILTVNSMQPEITWTQSLNEELPTSTWPVGTTLGIMLIVNWCGKKDQSHCEGINLCFRTPRVGSANRILGDQVSRNPGICSLVLNQEVKLQFFPCLRRTCLTTTLNCKTSKSFSSKAVRTFVTVTKRKQVHWS